MPTTADKAADQMVSTAGGVTALSSTSPGRESSRQILAEWLKVLAEPNRLKILDLLMQGEQCNCELGGKLGMMPNLISHHLGTLQKAGLVEARRDESDARWVHYSIDPVALARLTRTFNTMFDPARQGRADMSTARCAPRSMPLRTRNTENSENA